MKLSRLLSSISSNSRNHFEQILSKKSSGLYRFSSQASHGNGNGIPGATPQVFASYAVFKGKASLSITPCHPTFTRLNSGNLVINRRGSVMFTFCPAIGERKYDWERKQLFALSPTEVGTLISLGPKDSCEFFHDPAMLSSNAGQVRKNLSIKSQSEGNGYFISLSVVNNILKTKENFYVPFTTGEFSVMKTACSFALPHILGWDRLSKLTNLEGDVVVPSKVVDRQALSLEWEK